MLFASRERAGPDRLLPWKAAALLIGAVLLLLGYRLNLRWMAWTGLGTLVLAFALRLLRRRQ